MRVDMGLTPEVMLNAFTEEVAALGGRLHEHCVEGSIVSVRAMLPQTALVQPDDCIHAGRRLLRHDRGNDRPHVPAASGLHERDVDPASLKVQRVDDLDRQPASAALLRLRTAIRVCSSADVFHDAVHRLHDALRMNMEWLDMVRALTPFVPDVDVWRRHLKVNIKQHGPRLSAPPVRYIYRLSLENSDMTVARSRAAYAQQPARQPVDIGSLIADEFVRAGDRSRFGFINAITAVARQTSDPETKWRLEALGGDLVMNVDTSLRSPDHAGDEPVALGATDAEHIVTV